MTLTPDIILCVAGFVIGLGLGWVLFRKNTSSLEAHLAEKTAALETRNESLLQENTRLSAEKAVLENARQQMASEFKAMSLEALNASRENFLALAQEKFTQMQGSAQNHLKEVITPVSQTMMMLDQKITVLEKERHGAYGELREHLKAMKTDQDKLRSETSSLVAALRSPSTRGQWGEMQLKRVLEMSGLIEGVHYKSQVTIDSQRPDVVIMLPGGKSVVVDSKAPIDAYLDSLKDGITDAERATALERHARHVREHIKALSAKSYWEKFESPEFVVMFLPGESYFSAALERDPSLLEAGVDQRVIPSSPTTLISLLKAVNYGWQQERIAEKATEISRVGTELYKRLCKFSDHLAKIGKGLEGAVKSYNDSVGSFSSRVVPYGREIQKLQTLSAEDSIADIRQIEQSPSAPPDLSENDAETPSIQKAAP